MVNHVQEPQEWGVLHDVMLIYLAFIHGSNAIQTSSIQRAALQRVLLWLPDIDPLMLERTLNEAMLVFVSTSGPQMLNATVPSLAWLLPEQQRATILIDLAEMACEDGVYYPEDADFIEYVARAWNVEHHLSPYTASAAL